MIGIGDWLRENADLDRVDRELLLCQVPGITRVRILTAPETLLSPCDRARLDHWSARRRAGEPIAYIIGRKGFWNFELQVTPDVLVPRPETEGLVEIAIERLQPGHRALDLGTGSGAVAIAMARETAAEVCGSDISRAALALAQTNARSLGVQISWIESDWLTTVTGTFDLIVSNPPYIAAGDVHLDDLRHEPINALVAGIDGLDAIRQIVAAAPAHLQAGGWLVLEHGFDQGPAVRALLRGRGFTAIETQQDLAGLDRISLGQLP